MPSAEAHFREVAPKYMALLLADFPRLNKLDAAAVFGNAGHESKGLTDDQEDKPVVKGSRGGLNWMQWTGPRRRAMESYCKRNKLDPNSDIAAYKWLWVELHGVEANAIPALRAAVTLEDKVIAFSKTFLRPGIPHYESRQRWARIALEAFESADWKPVEGEQPPDGTTAQPDPETPPTGLAGVLAAIVKFILSLFRR